MFEKFKVHQSMFKFGDKVVVDFGESHQMRGLI